MHCLCHVAIETPSIVPIGVRCEHTSSPTQLYKVLCHYDPYIVAIDDIEQPFGSSFVTRVLLEG